MEKSKIFILVLLMCAVGSTSSSTDEVQEVEGKSTLAWPFWPPFPWWRLPPWWLPPPPHHHPKHPPHHHHRPPHPPRHHKPPSPQPPSPHNPPSPPPPSHKNPPSPPPPRHNKPPSPRAPPQPPSAPADQNPPPPKTIDPADCSKALISVDGCIRDLITSFFGGKVSVGGSCCRTILRISDDCFTEGFTQFKAPQFIGSVRDFCARQH